MNLFELFVKIGAKDEASGTISKITKGLGKGLVNAAKIGTAAVGAASAAIVALTTQAINGFAEYEQLVGGAQKIFDQVDYSKIANDANNAYKELGISASQYLSVMNDVGATFAATMGDEAGYEAAKTGLQAIADYASGTGKNVDELMGKFTLITRSTASYQSIADQFSGILPATSAGFLEQAQAAGILSKKYKTLTEVPLDEYQAAVSQMLQRGVADLGLAGNAAAEAMSTISGSLAMTKASWSNLVTGLADDNADLDMLIDNFVESVGAVVAQIVPKIGTALNGVSKLIQKVVPTIVKSVPKLLKENLPTLVKSAVSIFESIIESVEENKDDLFDMVFDLVEYVSESFLEMLPKIIDLGLSLIVSLAEGIAESAPKLVPTIIDVMLKIVNTLTNPETLSKLLDAAVKIIECLSDALLKDETLDKLIDCCVSIITTIATLLIDNIDKLFDAAVKIIEAIVDYLTDPENLTKLATAGLEIIKSLGNALAGAVEGLSDGITEVISFIVKQFTGIDLTDAGKEAMKTFILGMLGFAKTQDVKGIIKGYAVPYANGLVSGGLDGSHRGGLDYVPYDGYIAELHKGEKVLTASEARNQDKYDLRNVNVSITIDENVNAMGFARELLPYLKIAAQEAYG